MTQNDKTINVYVSGKTIRARCSNCGKVIRGEVWFPDDTRDKRLLCFTCAPDDAIRLKDTI